MKLSDVIVMFVTLELVNVVKGFGFLHMGHMRIFENEVGCRRHHYQTTLPSGERTCVPCTKCPAGWGVKHRCGASHDTVCEPCVPGHTFSSHASALARCHRCSPCGKSRDVLYECHVSGDRVCGACPAGSYFNPLHHQCEECAYCFPTEPGLTFKVKDCDVQGQSPDYQCVQVRHAQISKLPPPAQIPMFT